MENAVISTNEQDKNVNAVVNYSLEVSTLTEEQKASLRKLTEKITPNDMNSIRMYGTEINKTISSNDNILSNVSSTNSSQMIQDLKEMCVAVKKLNWDKDGKSNAVVEFCKKVPLLKNLVLYAQTSKIKYNSVGTNFNDLFKNIENAKVQTMSEYSVLTNMFKSFGDSLEDIKTHIKALYVLIQDEEAKHTEMEKNGTEHHLVMSHNFYISQLRQRMGNMMAQEALIRQNLRQIVIMEENAMGLVNNADNILVQVLPVWKKQTELNIIAESQNTLANMQMFIKDKFQEGLVANAKTIKDTAISVATSGTETFIRETTLKDCHDIMVDTLNQLRQIHNKANENYKSLEHTIYEQEKMFALDAPSNY